MQQPGGNSAMTATNDQQPINVDVSGAAEDVAVELDAETVARFQFHGQDVGWLLDQRATNRADHPFLVWEPKDGPSRTWTYGEFAVATRKVAVGLAERGVGVGDAVLIHAENCPEAAIAWYAVARLGGIAVTTNTRSVAAELSYFIEHSGAVGAITQPKLASVVAEAGADLAWVVVTDDNAGEPADDEQLAHGGESFDSLFGDADTVPALHPDPLRPVSIMFTSGTTSKPKAVVHTHGAWRRRHRGVAAEVLHQPLLAGHRRPPCHAHFVDPVRLQGNRRRADPRAHGSGWCVRPDHAVPG